MLTIALWILAAPILVFGGLIVLALFESAVTDGQPYDPSAEGRVEIIERQRLAARTESATKSVVRRPGPVYSLPRDPAD